MAKVKAPSYSEVDKKWMVEDDLRALQKVCEIKKDPKRMAAVVALAKERLEENAKIIGMSSGEEKGEY